MIHFFRRIRQGLLSQNRFSKYMLYAIGEIILVVFGILIALQINSWNEGRKLKKLEHDIYLNLIKSLEQDSTELNQIIILQKRALECQETIITNNFQELVDSLGIDEMKNIISETAVGGRSFFPKYGVYNAIISEGNLQIIRSDSIKSILIDLYDYQYKKYQSVDLLLDHKYYNELSPFISKSLGKISYGKIVLREMDLELVKINYSELSDQCGNVYLLTNASFQHLNNITNTVNLLLKLLNKELFEI